MRNVSLLCASEAWNSRSELWPKFHEKLFGVEKNIGPLLCFWAYASCHVTCVQLTMNCEPLQASALSFLFENGEFAVILIPTAALSGCGLGRSTL